MWESFPARVVCVLSGWCVPGGSKGLLKLSQGGRNWQAWYLLASWQVLGGIGGRAVLGDVLIEK